MKDARRDAQGAALEVASSNALVVATQAQLAALVRGAVQEALSEFQPTEVPALLERAGLARALGVGLSTVDRLRKAGMPSISIGDSPRFLLAECLAWLQQHRASGSAQSE